MVHSPRIPSTSTVVVLMSSATGQVAPTSSIRWRRSSQPTGRGLDDSNLRMASISLSLMVCRSMIGRPVCLRKYRSIRHGSQVCQPHGYGRSGLCFPANMKTLRQISQHGGRRTMGLDSNTGLQLRSLIRKSGELEVSLAEVAIAEPAADEVIVRVEATPINPSDLGLLFGAGDMANAKASGTAQQPVITAPVPEAAMRA